MGERSVSVFWQLHSIHWLTRSIRSRHEVSLAVALIQILRGTLIEEGLAGSELYAGIAFNEGDTLR